MINRLEEHKVYSFDKPFVKGFLNEEYFHFINEYAGSYFSGALHIYHLAKTPDVYNLEKRTLLIRSYYSSFIDAKHIFFAEDTFSNQFFFNTKGEVYIFMTETGEKEFIAHNLVEWVNELLNDPEYYTGQGLMKEWVILNRELEQGEKLMPKKPFVLGGKYESINLYPSYFKKIISFNSMLAYKIKEIPDGGKIEIVVTP